jgi:ubiquitin conjugation factor E4 B
MADQEAWQRLSESQRKEEEGKLLSCERHCPSFLSLANENVSMLKIFTEETPNAFLKSEIVVRLAAMLDYNLNTLAGPRCQTLKVKDPKKYHFQPKVLLSDLLQVYLNLWDRAPFHEAIANDGRSYTKELFERAVRIARKANLKSSDELQKLAKLVDKVEELKQMEADEELELGEIPDEFLGSFAPFITTSQMKHFSSGVLMSFDFFFVSRSFDGYVDERTGDLTDVKNDSRSVNHQATFPQRCYRPIQSDAVEDRGGSPWFVFLMPIQPLYHYPTVLGLCALCSTICIYIYIPL